MHIVYYLFASNINCKGGLLTNCALIGFTSDQLKNHLFNTTSSYGLIILLFGYEQLILFLKYWLHTSIPRIPPSISRALLRERKSYDKKQKPKDTNIDNTDMNDSNQFRRFSLMRNDNQQGVDEVHSFDDTLDNYNNHSKSSRNYSSDEQEEEEKFNDPKNIWDISFSHDCDSNHNNTEMIGHEPSKKELLNDLPVEESESPSIPKTSPGMPMINPPRSAIKKWLWGGEPTQSKANPKLANIAPLNMTYPTTPIKRKPPLATSPENPKIKSLSDNKVLINTKTIHPTTPRSNETKQQLVRKSPLIINSNKLKNSTKTNHKSPNIVSQTHHVQSAIILIKEKEETSGDKVKINQWIEKLKNSKNQTPPQTSPFAYVESYNNQIDDNPSGLANICYDYNDNLENISRLSNLSPDSPMNDNLNSENHSSNKLNKTMSPVQIFDTKVESSNNSFSYPIRNPFPQLTDDM